MGFLLSSARSTVHTWWPIAHAGGRRPLCARARRYRASRRALDHPAGPQPADGPRRRGSRRTAQGANAALSTRRPSPRPRWGSRSSVTGWPSTGWRGQGSSPQGLLETGRAPRGAV